MGRKSDSDAFGLDWDTQALWVQDRLMYVVASDDPLAETVAVQDQMGRSLTLDRGQLEATHVAVRNMTVYKPRFRPVQAYCPRDAIRVELDGTTVDVAAGDALVRDSDGKVTVLPRHDFNCRYQFIAAAGGHPSSL